MAGEDPQYLRWVRTQPCSVPKCNRPSEAHHSRKGVGTGRRGHDHRAIPLCHEHHVGELHRLTGHFKGWTRARLYDWEDERIGWLRRLYTDDMPF